jgi:hypothetical protein
MEKMQPVPIEPYRGKHRRVTFKDVVISLQQWQKNYMKALGFEPGDQKEKREASPSRTFP